MATENEMKLELLKFWLETGTFQDEEQRRQWLDELRQLETGSERSEMQKFAEDWYNAPFDSEDDVVSEQGFTKVELEQALRDFEKF